MVSAGQVGAFAVASFILIAIPGPSVLFVVGRALAYGRRTALASVAGNAAGLEVVAACVALGIGNRRAGHVPVQMLLLSLVSFAIALVSDSAWGLLASTVRAWFACSPRRLQLVSLGGGLAMIALGLLVAVTGRTH